MGLVLQLIIKGKCLQGGRLRLFCDDGDIYHHCGVSAYAEYAVMSQHSLIKIDKDIPFHIAALMGCAVLTGTGSIFNTGYAAGATEMIALDIFDKKLKMARDLGATKTYNVKIENLIVQVQDDTAGGVDSVFEYAGSTKALAMCYALTKCGGHVVTAGLPNPKDMRSIEAIKPIGPYILASSIIGCADMVRMAIKRQSTSEL